MRSPADAGLARGDAPDVLLLDEPLGALDALTRLEMQELATRVWQDKGFTAIVVTHDVAEAVALADRIPLLEDGQVALDVAVGGPSPIGGVVGATRPRAKTPAFCGRADLGAWHMRKRHRLRAVAQRNGVART